MQLDFLPYFLILSISNRVYDVLFLPYVAAGWRETVCCSEGCCGGKGCWFTEGSPITQALQPAGGLTRMISASHSLHRPQ